MLNPVNIKSRFFRNVTYLKSIPNLIDKISGTNINSKKLKQAATRLQVPKPFEVYINYIEQKLNIKFPSNYLYTKEEVIKSDLDSIERFSRSNFNLSELNIDYLIQAAIVSATELGIHKVNGSKHTTIDLLTSLEAYPSSTSSGYPVFKQKSNDLARNDALEFGINYLDTYNLSQLLVQPTAVFHRFQYKFNLSTNSLVKKVRQVWGVSYRILGLEGLVFRNMVNYCTQFCLVQNVPPSTWGRSLPNISKNIIPHIRSYKKNIISLDIQSFDSNVPAYFWALFYSICTYSIDFEFIDDIILDHLMVFDCYTPYCYGNTKIKFQMQGVPSGSLKTSMFTTFVNRTIINYACLEHTRGLYTANSTSVCLGDDNIVAEVYITLGHLTNVYKRIGMSINVEKSSISPFNSSLSYLGYIWDEENRPTQTEQWYIAHYCIPSRFYRNTDIPISLLQTYRAITISMVLYKGMDTFEYLIGWADTVWHSLLKEYHNGGDPIIHWISEDQTKNKFRIPLSIILTEGWTAF